MAELEWDDTFLKAKMNRAIERGLTVCALVVENDAAINVSESSDTGQLKESIGHEVDMSEVWMKKAIVKATAVQTSYVEYGRDPGKMPVEKVGDEWQVFESLVNWVERNFKLSGQEAKDAAWAVALKIKHKGIAAKPFMRPALDNNSSKFEGIMKEEIAREFR